MSTVQSPQLTIMSHHTTSPATKKPAKTTRRSTQSARYIVKRDGRKEVFYPEKIARAIQAAILAADLHDHQLAFEVAENVVTKVELSFSRQEPPTVEDVQDLVEQTLVEMNQYEIARAYIVYRQERSRIRNSQSRLMQTYQGIAVVEAKNFNLKRDNANVDGDTAMGKMLQFGAEGSKEFTKSFLMSPKHVQMHESGDLHVHDLDFYAMGTLTCCQIDVMDLFERGFSTGHGHIRTPNSIASYAALAAIVLQSNQNEQHGGQSIPNFDYALAKGVKKSFRTAIASNLEKFIRYQADKAIAPQDLKALIPEDISYPTLSSKEAKNLLQALKKDFSVELSEKDLQKVLTEAQEDTKKQTFQAMEGLIHNLNTMHSRAGAQVPFTSINFGTDTSEEGRLVSLSLLEATEKGLGKGETAIFPISILKVKEGINYNPEDPNYDLFQKSIQVSAKRLFPNFVFLDAPFNLQYYKKGDYRSEVATMGCRTRVMASVFPESDGRATSRGNISFTTINLPRIAINNGIALGERKKADWDGFYAELNDKIDEAAEQLLERFEVQANKTVKNFPFLMGQGVWMDSEKLKPNSKLRDVIKHGTLSVGFIGLAESLVALTGEHHGQSPVAQKLGIEIIGHMRARMDELSKKHQLNFSLLATPAEGIAGRFTKLDREEYGSIEGVTDREYYTNSYHVPVYYHVGAFDKVQTEAPYHAFCNAGHITYVELDGDPSKNLQAFESVVRAMKEAGIGYGSINHPVDRDSVCGFNGIIDGDECPGCGRHESDDSIKFERIRRITGYLVGTLDRWNDAKQAEERERVKHGVNKNLTPAEKRKKQVVKK